MVPLPKALALVVPSTVPELIFNPPLKVLFPLSIACPAPALAKPPLPLIIPPKVNTSPLLVTVTVWVVLKAMARLMVLPPEVALSVMPLVMTMELPARVKPLVLKVIEENDVLAVKLLLFDSWVVPVKTRASPAEGAIPPQLLAVIQLASEPPPVHTSVASQPVLMVARTNSSWVGMRTSGP